jgi:hypothetical protein
MAYIIRTGFESTDEIAAVLASLLKAPKKRSYSVSGRFNLAAHLFLNDRAMCNLKEHWLRPFQGQLHGQ